VYAAIEMTTRQEHIRAGYDRVATSYAEELRDELQHKPLDRALLDTFVEHVRGRGPVTDIGCGPGHIAAYLHRRGLEILGLDLSEEMLACARRTVQGVEFRRGDMLALDFDADAWAGIVAFYSIVHLEPEDVRLAIGEFWRVLQPEGRLLLSFHAGSDRLRLEEWLGASVEMEWIFFSPAFVERELTTAGFAIEARILRAPYTPFEHPSQRAYILAQKRVAISA
jgi:ubiquinone/menaquinone biosynthesis C-methylase UbiE